MGIIRKHISRGMHEDSRTHRLLWGHVAIEWRARPWRSAISGRGHPIPRGTTCSWWGPPGRATAHSTAPTHPIAAPHSHPRPCCWPSRPWTEAHATARRTPTHTALLRAAVRATCCSSTGCLTVAVKTRSSATGRETPVRPVSSCLPKLASREGVGRHPWPGGGPLEPAILTTNVLSPILYPFSPFAVSCTAHIAV